MVIVSLDLSIPNFRYRLGRYFKYFLSRSRVHEAGNCRRRENIWPGDDPCWRFSWRLTGITFWGDAHPIYRRAIIRLNQPVIHAARTNRPQHADVIYGYFC